MQNSNLIQLFLSILLCLINFYFFFYFPEIKLSLYSAQQQNKERVNTL